MSFEKKNDLTDLTAFFFPKYAYVYVVLWYPLSPVAAL